MSEADKARGFYQKYTVFRKDNTDRPGCKHNGCEYLVLDMTHDQNCHSAVLEYADQVEKDGYHLLAADLRKKMADLGVKEVPTTPKKPRGKKNDKPPEPKKEESEPEKQQEYLAKIVGATGDEIYLSATGQPTDAEWAIKFYSVEQMTEFAQKHGATVEPELCIGD